jgi:hypothetical protein
MNQGRPSAALLPSWDRLEPVEKGHKSYNFLGLGSVLKLWKVTLKGYFVLEKIGPQEPSTSTQTLIPLACDFRAHRPY